MMENDDKLLNQFFAEQKQEIEDKGFSRRVMRRLPEHRKRISHLWQGIFSLIATALFIGLGGVPATLNALREVFISLCEYAASSNFDPKSLIIAGVVLAFLGMRKLWAIT